MTSQEIIEQGDFVDVAYSEYDDCTNEWVGRVYRVCDDLWMVEFCNGSPCVADPFMVEAVPVETYEYVPVK